VGLKVTGLRKTFGKDFHAVDDCSFEVASGEFVTLLGPSGCGKSTTLRCIAGLERPSGGRIVIDDQTVSDADSGIMVTPERRNVGMVFQSYALWPHLSVFDNVAFPLKMRSWPRKDIAPAVQEALALVGLSGLEGRYPGTLSGGQQQRVSLARGVIYKPKLLLFDEPLSNLDARLRERMRVEIQALQRRLGITTVYVTHDQVEAMSMSDRVIVMRDGRIRQNDSPQNVYLHPRDAFVASFVGVANFLRGVVVERNGSGTGYVRLEGLSDCVFSFDGLGDFEESQPVSILVRPEEISVVDPSDPACTFSGEVSAVSYLGAELDLRVKALGQDLRVRCSTRQRFTAGAVVGLSIDNARSSVVPWSELSGVEAEE
jgi:iron(III) transport system ATP-binding protein